MKPSLIVKGAAGRMGKRILVLNDDDKAFSVVAAIEYPKHPDMGKDAGLLAGIECLNVPLSSVFPEKAEVMIDFSLPEAADATIHHCADHSIALVLGTT